MELRYLNKRSEEQAVAHQLAMRAEGKFNRERQKLFDDAHLDIMVELEEYRDKLRTVL